MYGSKVDNIIIAFNLISLAKLSVLVMNVRNGWPDGDWSHEQDGCDVVEEGGHQYCVDAENIDEHPYPPSHHLEELDNNNARLKNILDMTP